MADRGIIAGSPPNPRGGVGVQVSRGMGTFSKRPGTDPVNSPYELTEDALADGTNKEQKARLLEESIGYPNLAGDPDIVARAREAVDSSMKDVFNVQEFMRNKWLVLYRLYRGESLDTYNYGRAKLHSPEPYKIVETMLPKVLRTLFGSERWFRFYGQHYDHDASAQAQEVLCRDQLRQSKFLDKATRFIRDGLIYGTAIQKCYWKQEHGEMRYRTGKRIPDPKFPGTTKVKLTEVKRQELTFDGNEIQNVSIFDFFTSPSASSLDDAEWAADRSQMSDYQVKVMGELGHWLHLEELRDHPGSNDSSFGDEFKERKSYAYGIFDPRQASFAPHVPHYTAIDWYGPLVVKQGNNSYVTKICHVTMLEPDNKKLIVRVTEMPFWHQQKPYQAWRPISLEDEFYGIGLLEPIARLSMEKDMKRNLLMAATQLEANPMFMVSDEAGIHDGQLKFEPGLMLRVNSVDPPPIIPLHVPQVSDSALKSENVLTMDIRETSGSTSPSMGAKDPFGSDKTATQHMSEIDEANLRLVPMIQNYEQEVALPMFDQMTWNNQQFMSYMKVVREVGPLGMSFHDRYEIRPQDLIGRFLVQCLASHKLTTKQTQVQQLVNILDRAPIINQMYGPQAVKMPQLLAMILEQGFDIRNADEFITLPDNTLLTPTEEHELWYHGNVPPRRPDDNDQRHLIGHLEEMASERFKELDRRSPGTAARVRAHAAEHYRKLELLQLQQEKMLMEFAQVGAQMGLMNGGPGGAGGESPIEGAGGPGQEPGSPKVRSNETERGGAAKSEGMSRAPNPGAS